MKYCQKVEKLGTCSYGNPKWDDGLPIERPCTKQDTVCVDESMKDSLNRILSGVCESGVKFTCKSWRPVGEPYLEKTFWEKVKEFIGVIGKGCGASEQ